MNNKVSSLITRATALALFASPLCHVQLLSQEVYSQIVGAIAIDVPAESDIVVAFPFKRSASFRGAVSSASGTTVTVADSALTAGEFDAADGAATHFLYVEDGALKGRRFDIASNAASTVTLNETPTGLAAEDTVSVREHWTLEEAFPQGVGFVDESEPGLRQIELIVPETASLGGGLAADRVFYYHSDAWRQVGQPLSTDVGSATFSPGTAFVIRNNGSDDIRTYFFGEVVEAPVAIPVVADGSQVVDNFIGFERPLSIALQDLDGLAEILGPNDRLLVYGLGGGKNKQPAVYQYTGTQWQQEGSTSNAGSTVITAGEGIAIRRAAGSSDTFWVNEWSLPN